MRLLLYLLCVFIILLASALFIAGYEGTQIREFLLGVGVIVVAASRLIKPAQQSKRNNTPVNQTESQQHQRLSAEDSSLDRQSQSEDEKQSNLLSD